MQIDVKPHPRLSAGVELFISNSDGTLIETLSFVAETLEKSIEEAQVYVANTYPTSTKEIFGV